QSVFPHCSYVSPPALPPFPTRRSSDLTGVTYRPVAAANGGHAMANGGHAYGGYGGESSEEHWSRWPVVTAAGAGIALWGVLMGLDRKSTRLNSSHEWISYAVFCLKKKN